jgi:hypothetical protein
VFHHRPARHLLDSVGALVLVRLLIASAVAGRAASIHTTTSTWMGEARGSWTKRLFSSNVQYLLDRTTPRKRRPQ